jgi:hypothetical protein
LAEEQLHPACFVQGLPLIGIDGTRWNVGNTPQQHARLTKVETRRGSAAFAQFHMSALALLQDLPQRSLLILDRLYGQAPMLAALQRHCTAAREQHYVVRVRAKLAVKVGILLADGSALVEVSLRDKARHRIVLAPSPCARCADACGAAPKTSGWKCACGPA